ncbi:MAG: HK97 gp10 family phage protein [Bifidobacteriaceae bacterium]|jgi:hypothetical protein|nr:HK97 gp10 family phage protein [Bifidobacteriaceae bacterium]MCI1979423.1 HK97 gp10 family phage protein [Bifidobacteriaceae bacterium]
MANVTAGSSKPAVQVEGLKELNRTLKTAGANLKDLKKENKKAADVVVPVARTNVPVKSGKLLASIRSGATQKMGIVRAGKKSVPYAAIQEFGWPGHNIKPHHYIVDAAHSTEPLWVQVYENAVNKIINEIYGAQK